MAPAGAPASAGRAPIALQARRSATGVDTGAVGRLTPAWTYQLLALLSGLLLVGELVALVVLPRQG